MNRRRTHLAFVLAAAASSWAQAEPRLSDLTDVFVGGVGYPNYRTPSITAMPDGSLVAIAEGRTFDDPGYGGDLDLVQRRSTDGGLTWSAMQVIDSWAGGTSSNNTAVLDKTTGRLFVLFNRWEGNHGTTSSQPGTNNNTAWIRYSDDGGQNWSAAADITTSVKDYNNWNTMSFGPGSGIQASNGRLIIPAARWVNGWNGYAAYSNDHGTTWTRGLLVPGSNLSGENELVQLADGKIHMDARPNTGGTGPRLTSNSTNGGLTWSAMVNGQVSPDSQAAVERYTLASAGADANRILFTGPRGPDRTDLVIRTSYDETISYINERLLYDGYSGYSDITILPDNSIGVLFETNEARSLTFVKLNREWIEPPQRLKAFESFRYNTPALGTKNGGLLWNAGWSGSVATLTGTPTAKVEQSDLSYSNFPFAIEGKRRVFFDNGGTMARALPASIDLNSNNTYYASMLLRQDNILIDTESSNEALDVQLYAGGTNVISFGVHGNESFYLDGPGTSNSSAANAMDKSTSYYLVAKIVARDVASGLNDQMYLKAFRTGDAVPATDATLGWTLVSGSFNSTSLIDRLSVAGGSLSDWLVDEFRFGTSFGSVVSNVLQYTWNVNAGGNWTANANWFDGSPDGAGLVATFGDVITAPRVVTLDVPRTVGRINFSNAASYTIAGASTLTLNSPSGATLSVTAGSHTIATPISLASNLFASVATGASLTVSSDITGGSTATVTKTGAGTLQLKNLRAAALNLYGGTVKIIANSTAAGASRIDNLTILGGAKLDLTDNKLVTTTPIGSWTGSTYTGLTGLIQSGRNGGTWDGSSGIITSQTDALGSYTSLGIATAGETGRVGLPFAGITLSASDVLVMYTYGGDANLSGNVDVDDYGQIDFNAGVGGMLAGWFNGDFDYSGVVDVDDYGIIDFVVGIQGPPFATSASAVTSVPEPAVYPLAALIVVASASRRRTFARSLS